MAPLARIQCTATLVSRPPENAIPTRSPAGSDWRMFATMEAAPKKCGHYGKDGRRQRVVIDDDVGEPPGARQSGRSVWQWRCQADRDSSLRADRTGRCHTLG